MILDENIFDDIVEIEVPSVEINPPISSDEILGGPEPGEDTGTATLLLDAISRCAENIDRYNVMTANISDPELRKVIDDLACNENANLGKLQAALKSISPNAENIMTAAIAVEDELNESLNEGSEDHDTNIKDWAERITDYKEIMEYSTEVALDKFPENKEEILSVALDCRNTFIHLVDKIRSMSESLKEDASTTNKKSEYKLNHELKRLFTSYTAEQIRNAIEQHDWKDSNELRKSLKPFGVSSSDYTNIIKPILKLKNMNEEYRVRPYMGNFALFKTDGSNEAEIIFKGSEEECYNKLHDVTGKESKLNEGDWEDPEWRKYYGVDDDSFYDNPPAELEPEETFDDDFDDWDSDEDYYAESLKKKNKGFKPLQVMSSNYNNNSNRNTLEDIASEQVNIEDVDDEF